MFKECREEVNRKNIKGLKDQSPRPRHAGPLGLKVLEFREGVQSTAIAGQRVRSKVTTWFCGGEKIFGGIRSG